jgi:hypothetical protein
MKWNIISNISNQAGLEIHCRVLHDLLVSLGHEVSLVQFNEARGIRRADRNLFVELVVPELFHFAREQWIMPHLEWWFPQWRRHLPAFRYVLCATRHCQQHFERQVGSRAVYIGFEARDLLDSTIERRQQFLHAAGKSRNKNTEAVIAAWRGKEIPAKLIILAQNYHGRADNVEFHGRVPDEELRRLMNESLFHLMPSQYEGYGHSLHEAEGVGAVILTMNMAPMNEISHHSQLLIEPDRFAKQQSATIGITTGARVVMAVEHALAIPEEDLVDIRAASREHFVSDRDVFRARFAELANSPLASVPQRTWDNVPTRSRVRTIAQPSTLQKVADRPRTHSRFPGRGIQLPPLKQHIP